MILVCTNIDSDVLALRSIVEDLPPALGPLRVLPVHLDGDWPGALDGAPLACLQVVEPGVPQGGASRIAPSEDEELVTFVVRHEGRYLHHNFVVGLRVVRSDGGTPAVRKIFLRTLVQPFSAALLMLGYLPVLLQKEHRSVHDLIAGTAVVYDWGDRAAEMPGPLSEFLNRKQPA